MNKYILQKCTLKDIPYSLHQTVGYCLYTGICNQCKRMVNAVINRNAIKILRGNTITSTFYYNVRSKNILEGITFTFTDYIDILILANYMYDRYRFRYGLIQPHTDTVTFKSIVTNESISNFKIKGTPLVIDSTSHKFKKLLKNYNRIFYGKGYKKFF